MPVLLLHGQLLYRVYRAGSLRVRDGQLIHKERPLEKQLTGRAEGCKESRSTARRNDSSKAALREVSSAFLRFS